MERVWNIQEEKFLYQTLTCIIPELVFCGNSESPSPACRVPSYYCCCTPGETSEISHVTASMPIIPFMNLHHSALTMSFQIIIKFKRINRNNSQKCLTDFFFLVLQNDLQLNGVKSSADSATAVGCPKGK